jgi:hypothetical protein
MTQYIVIKKNCKRKYLHAGNHIPWSSSFKEKEATIFFDFKSAKTAFNQIVSSEYQKKRKDTNTSYIGYADLYYVPAGGNWSPPKKSKTRSKETIERRKEFNKKLKKQIQDKYEIRPIKISNRVLNIEKMN